MSKCIDQQYINIVYQRVQKWLPVAHCESDQLQNVTDSHTSHNSSRPIWFHENLLKTFLVNQTDKRTNTDLLKADLIIRVLNSGRLGVNVPKCLNPYAHI